MIPIKSLRFNKSSRKRPISKKGKHVSLAKIERHAFYERAKQAFAIVATGDLRTYGCVIIKKGVI